MKETFSVYIDKDKCIGSSMCTHIVPEVFVLGETGEPTIMEYDRSHLEEIQEAADGCPVGAIIISYEKNS